MKGRKKEEGRRKKEEGRRKKEVYQSYFIQNSVIKNYSNAILFVDKNSTTFRE